MAIDKIVCDEDIKEPRFNSDSLDTVCAALAYAMGIEPPYHSAERNAELSNYIDKVFDGEKADRIVMYNPDAIAQWIYQKYPDYFVNVAKNTDKEIYLSTVMPSVTPVCFGTMYTGAQPEVHGIQKYGPESAKALAELRVNDHMFGVIEEKKKGENHIYN